MSQISRLFLSPSTKTRINTSQFRPFTPTRKYHERVFEYYSDHKNIGTMEANDANVGTGLVGAPACGDVMRLQLLISQEGVVVDARFKTFGCGSAIASSALATEWVKGKTLDECLTIKNTEIAKHLSLPPVKLHCSMLAEDAIRSAVADYKKKSSTKLNSSQQK